ncbi:hypothetical protein PR048_021151 [Dryococelus australis]|uniref:Uncharacterized protein n=1 Tax=Dryococelus australis TaxID=614101 RepID=A0ABQ9GXH9_9NEOP|nr:hypothetical protein PR048_021151 [Dryococelus australis]
MAALGAILPETLKAQLEDRLLRAHHLSGPISAWLPDLPTSSPANRESLAVRLWEGGEGGLIPPPPHRVEPGLDFTAGVAPGLSRVGIVPNDAAGRCVFSGISHFPPPLHSGAAPHTHLVSPPSALKTSLSCKLGNAVTSRHSPCANVEWDTSLLKEEKGWRRQGTSHQERGASAGVNPPLNGVGKLRGVIVAGGVGEGGGGLGWFSVAANLSMAISQARNNTSPAVSSGPIRVATAPNPLSPPLQPLGHDTRPYLSPRRPGSTKRDWNCSPRMALLCHPFPCRARILESKLTYASATSKSAISACEVSSDGGRTIGVRENGLSYRDISARTGHGVYDGDACVAPVDRRGSYAATSGYWTRQCDHSTGWPPSCPHCCNGPYSLVHSVGSTLEHCGGCGPACVDGSTSSAAGWTGGTHAIASASIVQKPRTPQIEIGT